MSRCRGRGPLGLALALAVGCGAPEPEGVQQVEIDDGVECIESEDCVDGSACAAVVQGGAPARTFMCVAGCLDANTNTLWCADDGSCCDPRATCSHEGFCVVDEGAATTGDGEGSASDGGAGPTLWCIDRDKDGFGADTDCVMSAQPLVGSVQQAGDCDDQDPFAFPGAAFNEDAEACMRDRDGDGWGDALVKSPTSPGTDCHDLNAAFSPPSIAPLAHDGERFFELELATQGVADAGVRLGSTAPQTESSWGATAVGPDGVVWLESRGEQRLYRASWPIACGAALTLEPVEPGRRGVTYCGIAVDGHGHLWAIDVIADELLRLSTTDATVESRHRLVENGIDLDLGACGLTYNCQGDGLLVATDNGRLLALQPSGTEARATELAVTGLNWQAPPLLAPDADTAVAAAGSIVLSVDLATGFGFRGFPVGMEFDGAAMLPSCGP